LITPSLDEMVFVAKEMERRRMRLPLLIGGATTSRQHTAVKIAPEYSEATVHVLDASRVVDVVSNLLSAERRAEFVRESRRAQAQLREQHAARKERPLVSYEQARANRLQIDWEREPPAAAPFVGVKTLTRVPLGDIVPYIDWTFFFTAWDLKGRFPAILDHPQYGPAARDLYSNAQRLLDRVRQLGACGERVRILLNRAAEPYPIPPKQIEGALGHPIHQIFPSDYKTVSTALNSGVPLALAGSSEIATQFDRFTRRILDPSGEAAGGGGKKNVLGIDRIASLW
jgi:hypothetical protein